MSSQVGCVVNVYETTPATTHPSASRVCTIQLHIRHRYQVRVPTNEGPIILIEDVVSPELCTSIRIPIVSPLSMWRELYLSDLLKKMNLDASVNSFLNPKIAEAALLLAQRNEGKGFEMVAKVGILKFELLDREETDRIAAKLMSEEDGNSSQPKKGETFQGLAI